MRNIPLITKFLFIIAVFGLFVCGVAFYSNSQLRQIKGNYSSLINGESRAALYVARANRVLNEVRGRIGTLMMTTNEVDNERFVAAVTKAMHHMNELYDTAQAALPSETAIASLKAAAQGVVESDCAGAVRRGRSLVTTPSDAPAAQQFFLATCDAKFDPIVKSNTEVTERITKSSRDASDALSTEADKATIMVFTIIIAGLLLVLGLGYVFIRHYVTMPLTLLNRTMERLAAGDNGVQIDEQDRNDEIGSMSKTIALFKIAALDKIRNETEAANQRDAVAAERDQKALELSQVVNDLAAGLFKLSQGDLAHRLDQAFAAEFDKLRHDFNAAVSKLSDTMSVVAGTASAISSGTGEISTAADDLSRRTEQQAASLEETAAALDQITATVRKTAEGAMRARDAVSAAKTDAGKSGEIVREAVSAMSGIEKSSNQISQIIGVIDEIAFQTNLLALNAGVEAARAGDAGRGFAVVASEVRALAQRSADAAKEIKTLISTSGQQVTTGVLLVAEAGSALERIAAQVTEINSVVAEIAASAQEQATALNEVNTAVNQMDQVTQQNAAMVEQTTAASHSLTREAQDLLRLIGQFNTGVDMSRPDSQPAARSVVSPAHKKLALKSAKLGGGGARKPQLVASTSWEEF